MRLSPWQLSVTALGLCGLAVFATYQYREAKYAGSQWLFQRLPTDHAVITGIDVGVLRQAGLLDLLTGPRAEELDYRRFVDEAGFDYRSDLDYVAASISVNTGERHFLLNGRFDWRTLFDTAKKSGGRCLNTFCDLPGFSPRGNLSFLPLSPNTLGMSFAPASQAAWGLAAEYAGVQVPSVPTYPVFVAMDAGVLSSAEVLPEVIRPFSEILSGADYVVLGLQTANGGFELALDADCLSGARATAIRDGMKLASGPESAFHALFGPGSVHAKGNSVHARWPLDRVALATLANQ